MAAEGDSAFSIGAAPIAGRAGSGGASGARRPGLSAEVVPERIIGENTLRPVCYLDRARRAADAVVHINVVGVGLGTGFLIGPDLMITNHHVISTREQARSTEVSFFYEFDINEKLRSDQVTVGTADDALLYTNPELDVTLVRLQNSPKLSHYLPLRPVVPRENERVVIVQHPGGYLKKISLQNNLVAYADDRIVQYYTSTQAGSSGSPVLDDTFAVVAIHRGSTWNKAWGDVGRVRRFDPKQIEDLQFRNQGTSMIAFLKDLMATEPHLFEELTILD